MAWQAPALSANLRESGWWLSRRVYDVLGIKGQTMSPTLSGTFDVDGHEVVVFARGEALAPSRRAQKEVA